MADKDYKTHSYYPSAKVTLIIRFDEFGTKVLKPPAKATKNLNGIVDPRAPLVVQNDPTTPGRFLILPQGANPSDFTQPGSFQSKSKDSLTQVLGGIIPKEANWKQNGIRTADTLSLSLKYIDLPIDPRVVRSCAVVYYLGSVTAKDFAAGIAGQHRTVSTGLPGQPTNTEPLNLVPEDYIDSNGQKRTNLRFQGWVDKWDVDWTDSSEPMVKLECKDNTQLLLNQEVPGRLVFGMAKPVDKALADYLSNFPQFAGLAVIYLPAGETIPVLKDALAATAFRPNLGPPVSKGGGGSQKLAVWDYLTDIFSSIGHSVRMEGTDIIIQRVRSFTSKETITRTSDPFQTRTLPSGKTLQYRRVIWGRNIREMKVGHQYTRKSVTNVEVRCYSPRRKSPLVARFPMKGDEVAHANPGDNTAEQKWTTFKVSGVEDPKTLRAVAQNLYESISRQDITIDIKTRNLASFGGDNEDPDLLDIRPGDSIEVLVNRDDDETSTLTRIEKMLTAQAMNAEFMKKLGFGSDFAQAYAKAYTDSGFQTVYRVRTTGMNWTAEEGIEIEIGCVNYIEVRADKLLPSDEEPPPKL